MRTTTVVYLEPLHALPAHPHEPDREETEAQGDRMTAKWRVWD